MKKNYTFLKNSLFGTAFLCLSLVLSFGATAQNLNFTIDTAVDNDTDITETISNGGDTYVLTIDHVQDLIQLADIGGGDQIFFLDSGSSSTPYSLTITKNGLITNFMLNSLDYDTIGAGTISLANQDDEIISDPTFYPVGFGSLVISNPTNAFDITEIKIIPSDINDLFNFGFQNINVDILDTLSIETSLDNEALAIFPNPSNGNITIKNSGVALDKVVVSDLNGRAIIDFDLNGTTDSKTLDLSSVLSSGMYLMTIQSKNSSLVKKLVIQ